MGCFMTPPGGKKVSNIRWRIAALVFLATVINYIDRQTLSLVAPFVADELEISDIAYGNIVAAFLWAYTAMKLVSGVLIDRWGARFMLAASMVWWSVANMLHALARGALGLGIFRLLLGVGEAGNFTAAEKVISEWYPPQERGLTNGLVNAGAAAGAIVAPPLIALLYNQFGWRPAFVITGSLGFLWLIGWLRWYYSPAKHPRITGEELKLVGGQTHAGRKKLNLGHVIAIRQTWALLLARVFADPMWWFYLFWLPKYLQEERGFTMTEIGLVAWMPYLAADVGSIAGGLASNWLVKRKVEVLRARKLAMVPCVLFMPLGIVVAYTESITVAIAMICVVSGCHMAWKTNLMTLTNDIYPERIVASAAGLIGVGSGLGGALVSPVTGYIIQYFSYRMVFISMAFLHPIAMLIVWTMVHDTLDDDDEAAGEAAAPLAKAA